MAKKKKEDVLVERKEDILVERKKSVFDLLRGKEVVLQLRSGTMLKHAIEVLSL